MKNLICLALSLCVLRAAGQSAIPLMVSTNGTIAAPANFWEQAPVLRSSSGAATNAALFESTTFYGQGAPWVTPVIKVRSTNGHDVVTASDNGVLAVGDDAGDSLVMSPYGILYTLASGQNMFLIDADGNATFNGAVTCANNVSLSSAGAVSGAVWTASDSSGVGHWTTNIGSIGVGQLDTNGVSLSTYIAGLSNVWGAVSNAVSMTDSNLLQCVAAEGFQLLTIQRDSNSVATNATVRWPDGTGGVFTASSVNTNWQAIDAFTITYTNRSRTITQSAVSRDVNGAVTNKPALTIQ